MSKQLVGPVDAANRLRFRAAPADQLLAAELAGLVIGALNGFLFLGSVMLVMRRIDGALTETLDGSLPAVGMVALTWLALVVRLAELRRAGWWQERATSNQRAAWLLPTPTLMFAGWALTIPTAFTSGIVAVWSLIALEEAWAWGGGRWLARRWRRMLEPALVSRAAQPPMAPHLATMLVDDAEIDELAEDKLSDDFIQRFIRTMSAEEGDVLHGTVRTTLAAEQRTMNVHVAFCPAFMSTPEVEFHQVEGPSARIKLSQVLPWGMRLDVKLSDAGPARVGIEFSAVSLAKAEP
jgi:hypothetical protein